MPQVSQPLADDDILRFPRGPSAGECLHRMFELADFTRPSTWPAAIEAALDQRPPNAAGFTRDALKSMMARLLADVVAVPLGCDLTLAAIGPAKRLTELEFVFPVNAIDLSALRRTLVAHGYPDVPLDAHRLDGYLKGFIDAVVEFAGRFWIVDWKSNHLGDTRRHYAPEALPAAMATHAYHLQALIYTVALHRYLRTRLPGYDYETHTGASLYLFVRGVRPAWPGAGVHTVRASRALVDDLDRLFGGSAS
jgi:exodeoxyribonuclease V beta subunit